MVSKAKLYSKLDALEVELKERLLLHLKSAANDGNDLVFCVSVFNSVREFKNQTDKTTEELIGIGSQILSLRDKLGEPSAGTVAERICWYCREWSNNHKKSSSAGLAKQFLIEIESE